MNENETKQRHGFVSAWLWLVIVANLYIIVYYAIIMFGKQMPIAIWGLGLHSMFALGNVLGAILLMRWDKCGFYLFVACSITSAIVDVGFLDLGVFSVVWGVVAILMWWGILHIKKNGVSAWKLMNGGWDYKHCRHLYQLFGIITGGLLIATIVTSTTKANTTDVSDGGNVIGGDTVVVDETVGTIWKRFSDDGEYCSIEAPDGFRKSTISEDQILGLMCTDNDPAVVVIKESSSDVKKVGIDSPKKYAEALVQIAKNVDGATNFKEISRKDYSAISYLIVYDEEVEGTKFRYYLLTTRTSRNFYSCTICCLSEYSGTLENTIFHMIDSFEPQK